MEREALLVMRVGVLRCALPLSCAVETLRPMPVRPLANAPPFVAGACVIRGEALPVVDLGKLLGVDAVAPQRFVVVRAGPRKAALAERSELALAEERKVALAVEAVSVTEPVALEAMGEVPPLLSAAGPDVIAALATLDSELLVVLQTGRLVPDEFWDALPA